MVKKKGVFVFAIFALVFLLSGIFSNRVFALGEELLGKAEQLSGQANTLSNTLSDTDALKEMWGKFFAGSSIGKFLVFLGEKLVFFNPVFAIVPGVKFGWNGGFLLSFIATLCLFILAYKTIMVVSISNRAISSLGAFALVLVVSFFGIIKYIGVSIAKIINSINSFWFQIIAYLVVIFVFIYIIRFSGVLGGLARGIKRKRDEEIKQDKMDKMQEEIDAEKKRREELERKRREERDAEGKRAGDSRLSADAEVGRKVLEGVGRIAREGSSLGAPDIGAVKKIKQPKKIDIEQKSWISVFFDKLLGR